MSKYLLKKVCLKTPQLINLRNGLRTILYKKLYETKAEIRPFKRELYTYCYSINVKLDANELRDNYSSVEPNLGLSGKEVIENIQSFLEEMKYSDLDDKEKKLRCEHKDCEITRYFQGLDNLIRKSIVMCLDSDHREPSESDMYRLPILGTCHDWDGAWVCPEHFEDYRQEIIGLYSVDVKKQTNRIQLSAKSTEELEAIFNP